MRLPEAAPGTWPARVLETAQEGSVAYFYATGSYPALALLVDAGHPRTHGRHTFFPVLRPLQRAGLLAIDLPAAIPPFVTVARRRRTRSHQNASTLLYTRSRLGQIGAIVYAAVSASCGGVGWPARSHIPPRRGRRQVGDGRGADVFAKVTARTLVRAVRSRCVKWRVASELDAHAVGRRCAPGSRAGAPVAERCEG